jgi:hypothetical protein
MVPGGRAGTNNTRGAGIIGYKKACRGLNTQYRVKRWFAGQAKLATFGTYIISGNI